MSKVLRCAVVSGLVAVAAAGAWAAPIAPVVADVGLVAASDVPQVAGPDLLRWPVAVAPQLTNTGIWSEPSLLVSGGLAYRNGELLYQDFLYDDHGANGTSQDPTIAKPLPLPIGTYSYPSAPQYHNNAADLVEFRVKPVAGATAFRVTLNSLSDPELVGFTIALGGNTSTPRPYPFGANASGPAARFVTVHGRTAVVTAAVTGAAIAAPSVSVDLQRRQFTVVVPHAAWNPRSTKSLVAVGVGLWDRANNRYLIPAPARDTVRPGGSGILLRPPAFFNVGFRLTESTDGPNNDWREASQAAALAIGSMTPFSFVADFERLAQKVDDLSLVPRTGPINRILASHFQFGQGVDHTGCIVTAATH